MAYEELLEQARTMKGLCPAKRHALKILLDGLTDCGHPPMLCPWSIRIDGKEFSSWMLCWYADYDPDYDRELSIYYQGDDGVHAFGYYGRDVAKYMDGKVSDSFRWNAYQNWFIHGDELPEWFGYDDKDLLEGLVE